MRLPYYLAIRILIRRLNETPLILSLYARNSYALGTWTPGLSDIDLTVVIRAGASPEQELATIRRFWKRYASLQRWFVMLGEVEIMNEAHFPVWTRFAATGYEARHWMCLYGVDQHRSGYHGDAAQLQQDRLNHAIGIYCHQMAPGIGVAHHRTLLRYAEKIIRYLDRPPDPAFRERLAGMTREELHASIVGELASEVQARPQPRLPLDPIDLEWTLGRAVTPEVQYEKEAAYLTQDLSAAAVIESVLSSTQNRNRVYCILRESTDAASLIRCASAQGDEGRTVLVMPHTLFFHYLQSIDPLEHLAMLQQRIIFWGKDPLEDPPAWPESTFHQAICALSTNLLSFCYRAELEHISDETFRNLLLGWAMRIAHYFETGKIEFDYDRLVAVWRRTHPDFSIGPSHELAATYTDRFLLARAVVDAVHRGMARAGES